ncbi:magnesium transporter, partial [Pseudoalteromonas sp.]|uniref:magnesium transporter n=1 Tax=Pseudoalteromonas sp. TaxID=53249 RepID=UPI0035199028
FDKYSKEAGTKQYLIPYFISAHPGTKDEDMVDLAWWLTSTDFKLGAVLAFAMFMNLGAAGIAGASIPLILKKMKIDPALAGSVVLTTVTDIVGIFAFLGTATWLLI